MNDARNWRVEDPDPGRPLAEIQPVSRRALALLARSAEHALMRSQFVRLFGTIAMLDGLDYHHRQSLDYLDRVARAPRDDAGHAAVLSALDHEAVAYVGRAGQFVAFALSDPVRAPRALVPKLLELKFFRDKFVAHRSMDAPRGEDANTQVLHATSVTTFGGFLLAPKDAGKLLDDPWDPTRYRTHYLVYQARRDAQNVYFFSVERDHATVMAEAYGVLERLFAPATGVPPE